MEDIVRQNHVDAPTSPTRWGRVAASLRKGTFKGLVLAVVLAGVFGAALPTQAGEIATFFGIVMASFLQLLIGFFGDFFLLVTTVLINVASYNDFVVAVPVEQGWTIVRDVTNMFFILVLLVIAFGTILGIEEWGISKGGKRLSGLLIMAVVVNFSRTICGLLIDFSQVVMLTFVYGFREAAGANFFTGLQLDKTLRGADAFLTQTASEAIKTNQTVVFGAVVALILALCMIVGATIIVMYLTLMLIVRIVYLWLLIVLSPLAFFMKIVPGSMAKSQYADWWKRFNSQLVFGPLMAFFLWLSLYSVSSGSQLFKGVGTRSDAEKVSGGLYSFESGNSAAFTTKVIQEYLIALCLMVGGAFMAQGIAGATGSVATKASGKALSGGAKAVKGAWRGAKWTGGEVGRYAGMLPAGAKDSVTGMRPTFADRLAVRKERGEAKKQAKVDLKEDDANLRKLSVLRANPKTAAAAAAFEKELVDQGSRRLGKEKSPKELRDIMNDESKNKIERQRATLALARKGDEMLKGKGADLSKVASGVGGGKDFELQLRQALKENGDTDAMIMSSKQIQDKMAAQSAKQNANSLEGVANGVQLGADGKPKQTHAVDKLLNIDKEQYDTKDFSNRLKQQIQDALLVAANLDVNAGKKGELQAKFAELTGGSMEDPAAMSRAADLLAAAGDASLKARLAGSQPTVSPADVAAGQLIGGNNSEARRNADDRVKNMRERLAGGEDVAGMREEIGEVMQAYESIGLSEEIAKGTDMRNAGGQKMSGDEIVQASQFYKDLQAARESGDSKAAADRLAAAAAALTEAAGKSGTAAQRQAEAAALQKGTGGLQRADGSFDKALSAGSEKDKLTAAKKASTEGIASIDIMLKQGGGGMSEALKAELGALKSKMESIKQMKTIGATESETLQDIRKQMLAAKRKLS